MINFAGNIVRSRVYLVLVIALLAAGCSSSSPASTSGADSKSGSATGGSGFKDKFKDLIEAAKKEGTVVLYQAINEKSSQAFGKEFEAKFGITVESNHAAGAQNYEKFVSEARAGMWRSDVVAMSEPGYMLNVLEEGFIQDYAVTSESTFPAEWVMKGKGRAYPAVQVRMAIAYNTDMVKGDDEKLLKEKGWEALLDPRWKGKLGLADATKTGSYYALVYMMMQENAQRFGAKYVQGLAAQQPIVFESQTPLIERMAAGEVALGPSVDTPIGNMIAKGAPLRLIWPDPTPATLLTIALPLKTPHPNAGKLFLEYILSDEGNQLMANLNNSAGGRPGVSPDSPMVKTPWWTEPKNFYTIKNVTESNAKKAEVLKAWQASLGRN